MKLELKHLAPYLPYGLTGKTKKEIEPWKIVGYKEDSFSITEPTLLCTHSTYKNVINIWSRNIKPILRPLSDLTKEIEHKGDRFIPIIEYSYLRFKEIANYKGGQNTMKFIQVREQDLLFELKFDVFGLIDAGLAIDINTLDK